ncbi:uncharacterized protein MAL13P1.304 [Hydra vulgaris]|uniref:Uncharacterized protein MAL13P1.304 n=1 Tax=Hydra vulgaris TaxID=6087 RepID=A0ABM4B4J2_HYDVU
MYRKQLKSQGLSIERHSSMPEMTRDEFLEKMKESTTTLKRNNSLSNVSTTLPKRIIKTKVSSRLLQGTAASQGKKKEKISYVPINKKPDPIWTQQPIGNVDSGYQTQTFIKYYDFEKQKSFQYSDSEKEDREEITTFEAHQKSFNTNKHLTSDTSIEKKTLSKESSQKQTLVNESKYSKQSNFFPTSLPTERKTSIKSGSLNSKAPQSKNSNDLPKFFDSKTIADRESNISLQMSKEERTTNDKDIPTHLFQKYKDGELLQNVELYQSSSQETSEFKASKISSNNKEDNFSKLFSKIQNSNQDQISVDFSRRTFTTLSSGTFDSNTFKYIYTVDAELSYKEYNKLLSMINLLQGQKRKLEDEVLELKEKFEKTGKEKMQLAHNNHILRQSLDAANRAIKEINDKVSELKQTLVPLRQENTQLRNDNDLLKAEKVQIQKEVNELKVHIEVSKNEKLVMNNEIQDLKSLKCLAEDKLSQQSRENENYKNSMHEKFKKLEEAYRNYCLDMEKKLTKSNNEVENLREINESIKSETDSVKKEIEFLKEINGGLVKTNQKLQNEISQIKETQFSNEKNSKSEFFEAHKLKIEELNEEIIHYKDKTNRFKNNCKVLQVEIEKLKRDISNTENICKDSEAKYEMVFNLRKIDGQQIEILKEEAEELKKKLSNLNEIRDEKEILQKEKQAYLDQLELMRKEMEELKRLCSECKSHLEENNLLKSELEKFKNLLNDFEELKQKKTNDDKEKIELIGELQNLREQLRILEEKQKSISSPYNNEIKVELENLRQQMKDLAELNERRKIEIYTGEIKSELENLRLQFNEMNRPNQGVDAIKDENYNNKSEKNKQFHQETVDSVDQSRHFYDESKLHDGKNNHPHGKISFLENKNESLSKIDDHRTDNKLSTKIKNQHLPVNEHVKAQSETEVIETEVYSAIENDLSNVPDQEFSDNEQTNRMQVFLSNKEENELRQNHSIYQITNDQEKNHEITKEASNKKKEATFANKLEQETLLSINENTKEIRNIEPHNDQDISFYHNYRNKDKRDKTDFLNEQENIQIHQHKNEELKNVQLVIQSTTQTVIQPSAQFATYKEHKNKINQNHKEDKKNLTGDYINKKEEEFYVSNKEDSISQIEKLTSNEEKNRRMEFQQSYSDKQTTRTGLLNEHNIRLHQNRSENEFSKESFLYEQSSQNDKMIYQQNDNLAKKHEFEVSSNQQTNYKKIIGENRRHQNEFYGEENELRQNVSPLSYTQNNRSVNNIDFYDGDNIFHQVLPTNNETKKQTLNENDRSNENLIYDEDIHRNQITEKNKYGENQKMHESSFNKTKVQELEERQNVQVEGKNIYEEDQSRQKIDKRKHNENQKTQMKDEIKYAENYKIQEDSDKKYYENQGMHVSSESKNHENERKEITSTNRYEERQKENLGNERIYKETQRMQLTGETNYEGNQTMQVTDKRNYEENYKLQREVENKYKENKTMRVTNESRFQESQEMQTTGTNKYGDNQRIHTTSDTNKYGDNQRMHTTTNTNKYEDNQRTHTATNTNRYEVNQRTQTATDTKKYEHNQRVHAATDTNQYEDNQRMHTKIESKHIENKRTNAAGVDNYQERQRVQLTNENKHSNQRIQAEDENEYKEIQIKQVENENVYQENQRTNINDKKNYNEKQKMQLTEKMNYEENNRQQAEDKNKNEENRRMLVTSENKHQKNENVAGTKKYEEKQRMQKADKNINQKMQEKNDIKYEENQTMQVTDEIKYEEKKRMQVRQNLHEENHKMPSTDKRYKENTNNDFRLSQRDVDNKQIFTHIDERIESVQNQNINQQNNSYVSNESSVRGSQRAFNQDIFLKVPSLSHKKNSNSHKEESKLNIVQFNISKDNNQTQNDLQIEQKHLQDPNKLPYPLSESLNKKQDFVGREFTESAKIKHETVSLDHKRNYNQDYEVNRRTENNFSSRPETKLEKVEKKNQKIEMENSEHFNEIISYQLNQKLHNSQSQLFNKTSDKSKQKGLDYNAMGNQKPQANHLENTLRHKENMYFSNISLQQRNELSDNNTTTINTTRGRSPVRREHKKNKSVGSVASSEFMINIKQQNVSTQQEEQEMKNKRSDSETQLQKRRRLSEERRKKRRSNDGESSSDENISRQREPRKNSKNKGAPTNVEVNSGSDFLSEAMKSRQEKAFLNKIQGSQNTEYDINFTDVAHLENNEERTKQSLKNKIRKQLVDGIKKNSNWNSFSDSETRTINFTTTRTEHTLNQNDKVSGKAKTDNSKGFNNDLSFHKNTDETRSLDNRGHFKKVENTDFLYDDTLDSRREVAKTEFQETTEEISGKNSHKIDRFLATNKSFPSNKFEHVNQENANVLQTNNHLVGSVHTKSNYQSGSLHNSFMENRKKETSSINNSSFERGFEEQNIKKRYVSNEETTHSVSHIDTKHNVKHRMHSSGSLEQSKATQVLNQFVKDETQQVYKNSPHTLQTNQSNYLEKNKFVDRQQSSQFHKSHSTSEQIITSNVLQKENINNEMYAAVDKFQIKKQYSEAELEQMERMERARIKMLLSKGESDSPVIVQKFNSSSVKSSSLENIITKDGVPLSRLNKFEQSEYEKNLVSNRFMKSNSEYELSATQQKYKTLPKNSGKKSKTETVTRSATLPRNMKTQQEVISQEYYNKSTDIIKNAENTGKSKSRSYRDMKMDVDLFHKKSGSNLISNRQNFMSNDSLGGYSQITYTTVSDRDYEEKYDDFATQLDGSIYMQKNQDSKNVDESELLRHAKHIPKGHSKFRCEKCRALNATNRPGGPIHFCWERYFPISESTPAQSAMSLNRL